MSAGPRGALEAESRFWRPFPQRIGFRIANRLSACWNPREVAKLLLEGLARSCRHRGEPACCLFEQAWRWHCSRPWSRGLYSEPPRPLLPPANPRHTPPKRTPRRRTLRRHRHTPHRHTQRRHTLLRRTLHRRILLWRKEHRHTEHRRHGARTRESPKDAAHAANR